MEKTIRRGRQAAMTGKTVLFFIVSLSFLCIFGCDYARMRDQESVRTFKKEMPEMDQRTIPVQGGYQALKAADPKTLENPVAATGASIRRGVQAYTYFCIQCHGPNLDGHGTVGQSFAPLPTDLRSPQVRSQTDGELYAKIRLGFRRHPALYSTIGEHDAWAVVDYLKAGKKGQESK
jgi:mono/diheme cytochrome c family protein